MDVLDLAAEDLQEHPCQDAEHDAVGDGIGERHHDDGHKSAQHVGHIALELHLQHAGHHEQAHDDERRSSGEAGDGAEHGPQEQREDEHRGRGERGEARAAALGHAGGAFHIAGDGGGAQAGARHGADGVGHQGLAHAGQLAFLIQCGNISSHC